MMTPLVNASRHDGVLVLELSSPPANTYGYAMMRELDAHVLDARMDEKVHVILITGARPAPAAAGKKPAPEFFCAGADIKMLEGADPYFKYNFCLHANETLCRLEQTPKLVIAALNGHCVGGGLEVALACDLRIARKDAGKVGLPEVSLGVLPGTGGTQRLARLVGKGRALQLLLTGEMIDATEALRIGLVNRVVPAAELLAAARQMLGTMLGQGPLAVAHCIEAVDRGLDMPLDDAIALEASYFGLLSATADKAEGMRAFLEKRPAKFTGA